MAVRFPNNPLIQHRGQPSTHDVALLEAVIKDLKSGSETLIPSYDKGALNGKGERRPRTDWQRLNVRGDERVAIILLEGWCVGFRSLDTRTLQDKWQEAVECSEREEYRGRLGVNRLQDIDHVNSALRTYEQVFRYLVQLSRYSMMLMFG